MHACEVDTTVAARHPVQNLTISATARIGDVAARGDHVVFPVAGVDRLRGTLSSLPQMDGPRGRRPMKTLLKILSALALAVVLVAPFLHLAGWLAMAPLHAWLLGATIV
jgi:hypothetical protein